MRSIQTGWIVTVSKQRWCRWVGCSRGLMRVRPGWCAAWIRSLRTIRLRHHQRSISLRRRVGRVRRRRVRHAARSTLGAVPEVEAALGTGDVSGAHVDVLDRAMNGLSAAQRELLAGQGERLAAIATRCTPEQFARVLRRELERLDPTIGEDRLSETETQHQPAVLG